HAPPLHCDLTPAQRHQHAAYDLTGQTCYMTACKTFRVVPASYFLQHMQNSTLVMMHRGLGPQGTKALAVPLVTNTSILRLNLRDNWMEGMGGAAIAEMLKGNCYITAPRPQLQCSGGECR
uniref:Leucine rich repeat containing 74B n=1 Tax=Neolamprologus brichardi TaxID=32507 RepID=A0A3Q4MS88_NEOBR